MKIGITSACIETVRRSGVKIQGIMWRDALESLGHDVQLINYWDDLDYALFDTVIVLRLGGGVKNVVGDLKHYDIPVISAPIFDPRMSMKVYGLAARYGHINKLHLTNPSHEFHEAAKKFDIFLARSEYERKYLSYCYDINPERIKIVPLSFRIRPAEFMPEKENFCLHVSNLNAANKNVPRLIEAAKKYDFTLILGGSVHGEDGKKFLDDIISGHDKIKYIGQLSDDELRNYYLKAKVFALPSISEGVGMVALEAAACGCEIVLTNYGAPKEYYDNLASLVNPRSVDEIGRAVKSFLDGKIQHQPELMTHITNNYSFKNCAKLLEREIISCVENFRSR